MTTFQSDMFSSLGGVARQPKRKKNNNNNNKKKNKKKNNYKNNILPDRISGSIITRCDWVCGCKLKLILPDEIMKCTELCCLDKSSPSYSFRHT